MHKQQTQPPFTVVFHRLSQPRTSPKADILEARWLHQVFLFTHIPATWPAWMLAVGLLLAALAVWLVWWLFGLSSAGTAASIYLLFALSDWLLVWWLPRSGRSFGPIGPQLYLMSAPRLGVALLVASLGWLLAAPENWLWLFSLLQLLGTATYLWGMLYEPFALNISYRSVEISNWPVHVPPVRLLHLSDLHVERLTRREAKLLDLIEQARPDLIVITGDFLNLSYVDEPVARAEVQALLQKIHAPYGVYATLGSPPVDRRETTPSLFEDTAIRLLRDEVAVLHWADGRTLALIGMDCDHDLADEAQLFQSLLQLAPAEAGRVFLYHSPELMPTVRNNPVELYLCGHTHGGQIRLPLYGAILTSSALGKQYEMGAYREKNTTLYVSRGIGLEGLSAPRMRLLCPPEIILFTLSGSQGF